MIVGTGVDIAEVHRIRESIARFGSAFCIACTPRVKFNIASAKTSRALRAMPPVFAAKEAGMKALGTGWNHGVRWRDIEVVRPRGQRPTIQFHGQAAAFAEKAGHSHIALSITHTSEQALAHVILEA